MMKNTKKIKYSINSTVLIVGAIIITLLLNGLLVAFDNKISLEIDFTKDEIYRLTEETESVIDKIDEETKIVVLYNGQATELMTILTSVIEKYTDRNEKIKYEVVDYYSNPLALSEYVGAVKMLSSPEYAMIFVQGEKFDVAEVSSYITTTGRSNIENIITNKLATFVDGYSISEIMFTTGHGEKSNAGFEAVLNMYNYQLRSINLQTENIPENDKSLLIINAPKDDFSSEEIEKIDGFLDRGGNVQVYFDPVVSNDELPRLESYLAESWSVVRNHGVIVDSDKRLESGDNTNSRYGSITVAEIPDNEIATPIKDSKREIVYSAANALEIASDSLATIEVKPILTTSPNSVLRELENINEAVPAGVMKSSYNVMLTSTRNNYTLDEKIYTGRVVVCGSSYMMDTLIGDSRYANEDLLINSINWMRGSEAGITVRAKDIPQGALLISGGQFWGWFIGLVAVVPVLLIAFGIVVFVKRRYK